MWPISFQPATVRSVAVTVVICGSPMTVGTWGVGSWFTTVCCAPQTYTGPLPPFIGQVAAMYGFGDPPPPTPKERLRSAEDTVNQLLDGLEKVPCPELTELLLYRQLYQRGNRIDGCTPRIERLALEGR